MAYYTHGSPPPTFTCKCRVSTAFWGNDAIGTESNFFMFRGYLVHGTLDKAQYGGHGLLHASQELYGGPIAGLITSSLSRLFTIYCRVRCPGNVLYVL